MTQSMTLSVCAFSLDANISVFDKCPFINFANYFSDKGIRLEVSCITSSIGDFLGTEANIYYIYLGEIKKPSSKIKTFFKVLEEQPRKMGMYTIVATKEAIENLNSPFLERENVVFYEIGNTGETKDA